jgi:hypothetical protein
MLRELRDQSEAFETENATRDGDSRDSARFEVHLHGAMDLLAGAGCFELACRASVADRVARSVGLIADRVWLTDLLSGRFLDFGRPTNAKLDDVIADAVVLSRLLPLIRAGIVRFRSPWIETCSSCAADFDNNVETTADELASIFAAEFRIEKRPGGRYSAHTGNCIEPSMVFRSTSVGLKRFPTARTFARGWVRQEFRSTLWAAREASLTGGAILSNSRIGVAGLLRADGRLTDMNTLVLLDRERNFSVPWVSELDASQVLQLREAASSALVPFREKMARAMCVRDLEAVSSTSSSGVVAELREQAAEVHAALEAGRKHSARYWKVTYGLLGLGLSAYGVATDQLLPGVGGLLPVIHLLISHKSGHEADVSKLSSRPGYVLVKAKDILSHAHK